MVLAPTSRVEYVTPNQIGVFRNRTSMVADLAAYLDADGHGDPFFALDPAVRGTTSLYRDGVVVGMDPSPVAQFAIPSDQFRYRLSLGANGGTVLPADARSATTWAFASRGQSDVPTAVPLLVLGYDAPQTPAGILRGVTMTVTVGPQPDAVIGRVGTCSVAVSTDDAVTWRAAAVRAAGTVGAASGFRVTIPRVPVGSALTVLVRVADDRGSSVDQVLYDALRIG